MRKIGENTAYVRFDAKANRSQITWEKLRGGGGQIVKVIKSTRVFFSFWWSNGIITGNIFKAKIMK